MTSRAGGFTLAELLAAMAVGALVLVGAGFAFQVAGGTLASGSDQAEAQQNARWALERMIQEIRGAGLDPTGTPPAFNFDAVSMPTATSLVIQSDLDGNGRLDPPAACDPSGSGERVSYRLVGTELRRATDPPANACEAVVVGGVQQLTFTYFDMAGAATVSPAAVRSVGVTVALRPETGTRPVIVLTDRVRLRNR
ncbi:MAG TPA: prepilin-type N-terminal cleavage/methylation domain-containing protein [Candidatus Binatia bacterium]|jgi:prepilin-type N-terminal cleavage/methylation domain-containing protein|nr:prepilin-type N-terminal cleavage/methylation domain-containing protein [Candidatus Binatia bacterium]